MNGVKFGVIVPVFDIAEYLPQCIDSIIGQSYKNIEVALVDDGSTDGSGEICDMYAARDGRIKVIHKSNGGVVSARKAAASALDCDYLACIDGDDSVDPDYFLRFAEIISEHAPDIAVCGYIKALGENEVAAPSVLRVGYYDRAAVERELFPILIEDGNCVSFPPMLWAKVFKRDILLPRLDIDGRIKMGEDAASVIPCVYGAQSVFVTDEPLYRYTQNPLSATNNGKPLDWEGVELRYKHLERAVDMSERDFREQLYRAITHSLFNVAVSRFYGSEKYGAAAREVKARISDEYYATAIKNSRFTCRSGKLARFALRHKLTRLMKIYAKRKIKNGQ
ncbi:MAG: glycosyltransferase [Roseburia sp.]|nr:glycosyltransferase [Roseburia sp.]